MEANLCVLIDFENVATGCDKEGLGAFDVRLVLRRLKDKGRILVSRAYADWTRWSRFKQDLVFSAVHMMELTAHGQGAKNRADIALVVDAMEIAYTRDYIDTFVILSGDSDFTPLVMRLKELNKRVIGVGTKGSTSRLIADVCDEFMFYDTLRKEGRVEPPPDSGDDGTLTRDEALDLMVETLENRQREDSGSVHASVLKTAMKRKSPTFSEVELGFRTFGGFLEMAQEKGLLRLHRDERAGGYAVELAREERPVASLAPRGDGERALLTRLVALGCDIGTLDDRRWVTDQLVAACQERARRGRTCATEYLAGDLLRRVRTDRTGIPARVVKGILGALAAAGSLVSEHGAAAEAPTAPFVPPESAERLRLELTAHARAVLAETGERFDAGTLAEVFGSAEGKLEPREPRARRAVAPPAAGPVAAAEVESPADGPDGAADTGGEAESDTPPRRKRRRRRRGGGGGEDVEATPVEDTSGFEPVPPFQEPDVYVQVDAESDGSEPR